MEMWLRRIWPTELQVADLHRAENVLHLAPEGGEFLREVQPRHELQDDARGLEIEPLADLAERLVAGHRADLGEEIHVEARERLVIGSLRQRVEARDQTPDAIEVGGASRKRRQAADQLGELEPQLIDLREFLDLDVGDDRADAVPRLDQPLRIRAAPARAGPACG